MTSERVHFQAGGISLEGVLELPGDGAKPLPAAAVCHPHPLYGGDMYNDVVIAVCRGMLERGIAVLRFNFRGVGGSGGEHGGGYGEREDAWAALDYLRGREEIDRDRLGLAGYSFGAAVALNAGIAAGVRALAAVSAPPQMIDFSAMQGYTIPVLLIAGGEDQFGRPDRLQQLAIAIGPGTTVEIVPDADHFWGGKAGRLRDATGVFFASHLQAANARPHSD